MTYMRISLVGFLGILLCATQVHAQTTELKKIDDTRLQNLYASQLTNPNDEFLEKSISDERDEIRNQIETEYNELITSSLLEETAGEGVNLLTSADRQRGVIQILEERLRERKIDLDQLATEEQRFYVEGSGTSALTQFKTTTSYPQLLARKAVLEERISVLDVMIPFQKDRLERLVQEQRKQQFGSLVDISWYLLIIIGITIFERFIRNTLLVRIPNRKARYSVMKFFAGWVYFIMGLWILGVIYANNPGILTSFAIVGAGIAIALQDIIKDVVGWIIIHQSGLYSEGDRISIGGLTGEVVDIGLLHTKILEVGLPPNSVLDRTGKVLSIPNMHILTDSLNNYNLTSDYVKTEMTFAITYESNWKKAEEILTEVVNDVTHDYVERDRLQHNIRTRTMYIPYTSGAGAGAAVFMDIADDGVAFLLRFPVPIGFRRDVVSEIAKKILERFDAESDIDLAYKTSRILSEVKKV